MHLGKVTHEFHILQQVGPCVCVHACPLCVNLMLRIVYIENPNQRTLLSSMSDVY